MRPDTRDFLSQVLQNVEELPDELKERLLNLVDGPVEASEERSEAIRLLLEEHSRG